MDKPKRPHLPLFATTIAIFMLAAHVISATPDDVSRLHNRTCSNSIVRDRRYSEDELSNLRAPYLASPTVSSPSALNYLITDSTSSYTTADRAAFASMLTFTLFMFVSSAVFLAIFIFNKFRSSTKWPFRLVLATVVTCLVALVGVLVAQLVFAGLFEVSRGRVRCQTVRSGNLLINGGLNIDNGNAYVGLTSLGQAVRQLATEYRQLVNNTGDATNITSRDLPTAMETVLATLRSVSLKYSQVTTTNAFGALQISDSIAALTRYVSEATKTEFFDLRDRCQLLYDLGWSVVRLTDPALTTVPRYVAATADYATTFLDNLAGNLANFTLASYETVNRNFERIRAGYWTFMCLSIVLLGILSGVTGKLLVSMKKTDQISDRPFAALKIQIIVGAVLAACLGAMVMLMRAGLVGTWATCSTLVRINTGQRTFTDQYRANWPGMAKYAMYECLDNQGRLTDIAWLDGFSAKAPYLADFWNVFASVADYNTKKAYPSRAGSRALEFLTANYTLIQQGYIYDTSSIDFLLASLNETLTGQRWSVCLTNISCLTDAASTFYIDAGTNFPVDPSSPYYISSHNLYRNLKAYIISEQSVLSLLTKDLRSEASVQQSAESGFKNIQSNWNELQPSVQRIMDMFPQTVASLGGQAGMGHQLMDCRNVKSELRLLEDHICYEMGWLANILWWLTLGSFAGFGLTIWLLLIPLAFFSVPITSLKAIEAPLPIRKMDENYIDYHHENPVH